MMMIMMMISKMFQIYCMQHRRRIEKTYFSHIYALAHAELLFKHRNICDARTNNINQHNIRCFNALMFQCSQDPPAAGNVALTQRAQYIHTINIISTS